MQHNTRSVARPSIRLARLLLVKNAGPELGPSARLLLRSIADYCGDNPSCWPSLGRLARECGLSVRHTRRILRELEAAGWLARSERRRADGGETSSLLTWKKTAGPEHATAPKCPPPPGHDVRPIETFSSENTGHVTCRLSESQEKPQAAPGGPRPAPAADSRPAASELILSDSERPQPAASHPDTESPVQPMPLSAILAASMAARSKPAATASPAEPAPPAPAIHTPRAAIPAAPATAAAPAASGRWLRINPERLSDGQHAAECWDRIVCAGMLRESESMRLAWFAAWCEVLRKQRAGKVKNPAGVLRWLLDHPSVMAMYATASSEEKARSLLRRLAAQFHR